MASRRSLVVGNWKMNTTRAEGIILAIAVARGVESLRSARGSGVGVSMDGSGFEVGICPPFTGIDAVASALRAAGLGSTLAVGGQDVSEHPSGAYTGEVSAAMLHDAGAKLVIIGHSERRHGIGESDGLINKKVCAAVAAGLTTILCVGETEQERREGRTDAVNERQLRAGLSNFPMEKLDKLVVAYEPVWAIGTGKTATPDDAQSAHQFVRSILGDLFGTSAADLIRIQYGGSMKPGNAAELMGMPDIDGGLIGGASLKAEEFLAIVTAAAGVT